MRWFQRGVVVWGGEVWGRGAPGNSQAQAEWVKEEELHKMKARGCRERYGWREIKREAMYVGGGLSVGGMGGSMRQAYRRRQCHWTPIARAGISVGLPAAVIAISCSASPQTLNTSRRRMGAGYLSRGTKR